jgi:4-amino-4-deoxy-L-arabinose transferase-like glycosyltransferase
MKVPKLIALALLLSLAAFLRLYRISEYMQFQGDEGRDALVLYRMAVEHKFTLIGPGTSIGNMYNGPLYYYLILPAYILGRLSPVAPSILVALIGVATVWLVWKVGREWFSPRAAATAAILYAVAPTVIIYSRSSWNPNVMPFFALLTIYGVWRVFKGSSPWWIVVAGVALAFAIQSHYLGLLLVPTAGLWALLAYRRATAPERRRLRPAYFAGLAAFLVLMSPLLLFDLRHNWLNARAMDAFFTQRQETVNLKVYKALPNLGPLFIDIITRLIAAFSVPLAQAISLLVIIGTVVEVFRTKWRPSLWLLFTWIGFGLLGLGLYKQHIYDHYYGFFFPAFFLLTGVALDSLVRRFKIAGNLVAALVVVALVYVNLSVSPLRATPNDIYQKTQVAAHQIEAAAAGQPFNLGMIAKNNYDAGYRYILTREQANLRTIPPTVTEQLFVVCELKFSDCHPVGHPQTEIARFGWTKIDQVWRYAWGTTVFRLVHNPEGH